MILKIFETRFIPQLDYKWQDSPFGPALLGYHNQSLCYLGFNDVPPSDMMQDMYSCFKGATFQENSNLCSVNFWQNQLQNLLLVGTPFQREVWQGLIKIPSGHTVAYSHLAKSIGRPTAVRAVASAIGRNPITLLVPCHRVIHKNGGLGGFRMGTALKKTLLEYEATSYVS